MNLAGKEVSAYELLTGKGARWYWDRRYISEAEQEKAVPLPSPTLLAEIDTALAERIRLYPPRIEPDSDCSIQPLL